MTIYHLKGGCHCGNIVFDFATMKTPSGFQPRRCGCDFCTRHGGLYISDPEARLEIRVKDISIFNRYQFGHKTADFLICKNCGVFPAVVCAIDGIEKGVLNVNCVEPTLFPPAYECPVNDFESEDVLSRLQRRAKNWIGSVVILFPGRVNHYK